MRWVKNMKRIVGAVACGIVSATQRSPILSVSVKIAIGCNAAAD